MARRRMIDPSIWDDPEVGELTPTEFKLFIGLISMADDEGRLEADPRTLRKQLFGYCEDVSVQDVGTWLASVAEKLPNVCLYDVDDKSYIALLRWNTHQAISKTWKQDSVIPPPPAEYMPTTCQAHEEQVPSTFQASADHMPTTCPTSKANGKQAKQSQEKASKASDMPAAAALEQELRDCGVTGAKLDDLKADPWVTAERVRACWASARQRNGVDRPVGLLIRMLQDHDQPPRASPEPGSQEERYRYIRGKFAEYINVGVEEEA